MPRTILGLETRACVNGLTKTDFENVKQIPILKSETDEIKNTTIPALDERVTALEQGGSSVIDYSWSEPVTFTRFSELENVMNEYFEEDDGVYLLKYDTIVEYNGNHNFIPKGFSIYKLSFTNQVIDNSSSSNLRIVINDFNVNYFFFTQPENDNMFYSTSVRWIIKEPSNTIFTYDDYSGEKNRSSVLFYFKNNTNTE